MKWKPFTLHLFSTDNWERNLTLQVILYVDKRAVFTKYRRGTYFQQCIF